MTLIGALVTGVLMIFGKRPYRYGPCVYVEVGEGWGGLELGMFFIVGKEPTMYICDHEVGHALQNCYWGPLMPFVICIPSAIRYWYRVIRARLDNPCKTRYDDIWFEEQATVWGANYMREWACFRNNK